MVKHFTIKVSGKVQGVFFRASTRAQAEVLGVKGIVRNEVNGDVYIEAEAEEQVLQDFVQWCKRGPQLARVQHCEVLEGQVKHYKDFRISR